MAPLDDVRGEEHRQQPAGRDQDRRGRRRRLQVPVHGQGRRQRQQELPLPGDQGAAQREDAAAVAVREDEDARHRGLPAVPPRRRHRRHVGRVRRRDRQAGQHAATSTRCRPTGSTARPRRSATSSSRRRCCSSASRPASAPSSAASTSATTCASSACPATAPAARWRWPCRAAPTARRSARSPPTACSSSSSRPTRPASCPRSTDEHLDGDAVVRIDLNRPMDEIRAELSQLPGEDPGDADRPDGRRPRHRPRQAQGAPRRRRAACRSTCSDYCVYYAGPAKTPDGLCVSGSFGPTTAGRMDSYVDEFQAAGGSMVMLAKGNRSRAGHRRVQGPRRLLPRLDRRPGGPPGAGLHHQGRGARVPRARHGGGVEDRGRRTSPRSSSSTTRATTSSTSSTSRSPAPRSRSAEAAAPLGPWHVTGRSVGRRAVGPVGRSGGVRAVPVRACPACPPSSPGRSSVTVPLRCTPPRPLTNRQ